MESPALRAKTQSGFTFPELCIAIAVAAIFGLAAYATNERLLIALKSQRETTAASMMLQERMEAFRALSYSNVANPSYVQTNIVQKTTTSETELGGITGSLTETITVSGYLTTTGGAGYPTDGSTPNQWLRNSTYQTGHQNSSSSTLATSYDLLQVDIKLSWTSANGRTRQRELSAIFGKGNIGA
jgi:prepilin-type N-terminal cleavage/methylation domain-containing protein